MIIQFQAWNSFSNDTLHTDGNVWNYAKFCMVNRPKGITLLIIFYSIAALSTGFVAFSTEKAGDLVEERYGDQLKIYFFIDYDKNLAIIIGGVEVLVLVGLVILLINRSSKARIGILGVETFSIIIAVLGLILPITFFPQDHPYYPMHISPVTGVISVIFPAIIIFYMFRPKVIQYFKKANEQFSENSGYEALDDNL